MYCENCGALIPDSAKFCPECGNAQSPGLKAEPETLHCPYCGTELEPDSVFCENCGTKLNVRDVRSDQTPSISEQPQSYAVPPVPPEQEKTHVPSAPSVPPVPPAPSTASERTHVTAIPAPPSAAVRETAPEKKKKRSGCCSAVLIVLILLILLCLAACYYFWKVYEGDNQIKNLISGFMPTAEMILTKAPEAISNVESVLTKVPETVSGIIIKPTDTAAPVFQPTAPIALVNSPTSLPPVSAPATLIPAIPSEAAAKPFVFPTITPMPVRPTDTPVSEDVYYFENFETSERPRQADFLWVTEDILDGNLPAGRVQLKSIMSVIGGWKVFIMDDPENRFGSGMERMCNANVDAGQPGTQVTFHWYYVYNRDTQTVNQDFSSDSLFTKGTWNNGLIEALGPGKIELTEFYYLDGKEYAVGILHWPDGIKGAVFMVRP